MGMIILVKRACAYLDNINCRHSLDSLHIYRELRYLDLREVVNNRGPYLTDEQDGHTFASA